MNFLTCFTRYKKPENDLMQIKKSIFNFNIIK